MARRARAMVIALVITILGGSAIPASHAEEPLELDGAVIDRSGALGDRSVEVEAAVERLAGETGIRLFVVYVDEFSGWDALEWADETASRNDLGVADAVLAVATGERVYALSVDPESTLTPAQLDEIETVAIEPALRASDWAAAAVGAATALGDVRAGATVQPPDIEQVIPAPAADGPGVVPWLVGLAVLVLAAVVGWTVVVRRRSGGCRRPATRTLPHW